MQRFATHNGRIDRISSPGRKAGVIIWWEEKKMTIFQEFTCEKKKSRITLNQRPHGPFLGVHGPRDTSRLRRPGVKDRAGPARPALFGDRDNMTRRPPKRPRLGEVARASVAALALLARTSIGFRHKPTRGNDWSLT